MTGFKSKRAMAKAAYYAPNDPVVSNRFPSWRERLHTTYLRAISKYGNDSWNDIVSDCMDFMQRNYPGKYYTLHWIDGGLEPVFKNPKHETLWKIQYESV